MRKCALGRRGAHVTGPQVAERGVEGQEPCGRPAEPGRPAFTLLLYSSGTGTV